jgi:hypothetical protein
VHRDGVCLAGVYTLDDIFARLVGKQYTRAYKHTYLAVARPIWSKEPEGWPYSTAIRHVVQIQDEETVSICVVTDDSDSWSSWSSVRPFVRCVDTDCNTVIVGGRVAIHGGY